MTRREFIAGLCGAAAWSLPAWGQASLAHPGGNVTGVTLSEQIRLWLSVLLGPVVTALGFAFVFRQLQISAQQAKIASDSYALSVAAAERATLQAAELQNWKKAEFLANQVKDFFGDDTVERVIYMLDWCIRELILADDNDEEILTLHDDPARKEAESLSGLRDKFNKGRFVIVARALRKHDASDHFTGPEALVRDNFDWFFFRLGQFQHLIQSGLFSYQEVDVHLSYVLDLISGGLENVSPKVTEAITEYVREYCFPSIVSSWPVASGTARSRHPGDARSGVRQAMKWMEGRAGWHR
jgi:hypothetical protein